MSLEPRKIIQNCLKSGRKQLTEFESSLILASYGVAFPTSHTVTERSQLDEVVMRMNFPIVMKVNSPDIQHKTDAGCVFLGIRDLETAEQAWNKIMQNAVNHNPHAKVEGILVQEMLLGGQEVIVGGIKDPGFGPVIMAGMGGIYTEVFKDVGFMLAPITIQQATTLLENLRVSKLLQGVRGNQPFDTAALVDLLVTVSQVIVDLDEISELEINPVKVMEQGKGCYAVDALIMLNDAAAEGVLLVGSERPRASH